MKEDNEGYDDRYSDRDPVDDDALERARKEKKKFKGVDDKDIDDKSFDDLKKRVRKLDDEIIKRQSFKEFYNGK